MNGLRPDERAVVDKLLKDQETTRQERHRLIFGVNRLEAERGALLDACEALRLRGCKCAEMKPRACPQCDAIESAIAKATGGPHG